MNSQVAGSVPFASVLSGENAFYTLPGYVESTQRDFRQNASLPTVFTYTTTSKMSRIAKKIFSIIVFPVGLYDLVHNLAGKIAILPASNPQSYGMLENHADASRSHIPLNGPWKLKRIVIEVDGQKIDAMIAGTASSLGNGRWMLGSVGNGEFYEDYLHHTGYQSWRDMVKSLKANVLLFNYPGVGASSGSPNREEMAKTYKAMLNFLEDKKIGIGAKEIIGYGHSIGGGVQGDALRTHVLRKDVRYVFVKSRTFSTLKSEVSHIMNRVFGFIVQALGWNMDSVESSKRLMAPEIIMQTSAVTEYTELSDGSKIIGDGVIPAKASLAHALLNEPKDSRKQKTFLGIPEGHNYGLLYPEILAKKIEYSLQHP